MIFFFRLDHTKEKPLRRWVILNRNFLFYYASDVAEAPVGIILMDKCRVIYTDQTEYQAEEIRLRNQFSVETSVARWLGESEEEPKRKKKSLSRREKSSARLRGKFSFILDEPEMTHKLGCDSFNMLGMWLDACRNCRPWYKEFNFPLVEM